MKDEVKVNLKLKVKVYRSERWGKGEFEVEGKSI